MEKPSEFIQLPSTQESIFISASGVFFFIWALLNMSYADYKGEIPSVNLILFLYVLATALILGGVWCYDKAYTKEQNEKEIEEIKKQLVATTTKEPLVYGKHSD
jgi:hypothetical protein